MLVLVRSVEWAAAGLRRVFMGGLSASVYLRAVFLWIPSSLAIARSDRLRAMAF